MTPWVPGTNGRRRAKHRIAAAASPWLAGAHSMSRMMRPRAAGGRGKLAVGHAETGQHGRVGEVAIPPVEVVMPPHRSGGKPHSRIVRELPLDRSTHDLPNDSVGQFGLYLASAAVHADERLVDE